MTMKTHELIQGSPEWHAYRAQHFNASDAPAMMGCSPYMTRSELLTRMKTGITSDVDAATQRRFDDGHRFEELARSLIAEPLLGEDLFPVTGSLGELSASFDGITLDDSTIFEHKTLGDALRYTPWDEGNGDHLPLHYRVQMEQQLLVSGAQRVLFMASKWSNDTLVEKRHCWYVSDPELRAQIVAGWKQFAADLANFVPEAKAAPVVAAPVETLPAVSVKVDGALAIVSNLPDFGAALRTFIDKIPAQPSTDQEFADTEAACKALKKAEEALEAAESNALAQLSDVDTMRRLVADFKALARATRLQREKLVTQRKEAIKGEIVAAGVAAMSKHIRELNAALPADYMPTVPADFGGCIKGLRTVDSIRNAVDTELARAKIHASEIATRIQANLQRLENYKMPSLFPDVATLVLKAPDDLAAIMAQRIDAEQKRVDEAVRRETERIRAEEAARLEREAAAKAAAEKAEADRAERERARATQVEADRIAREQAEVSLQGADALAFAVEAEKAFRAAIASGTGAFKVMGVDMASAQAAVAPADDGARLTLGQINEMLSPVSITGDGLAMLGFQPVERVKASKLYRACDFDAICRAICNHINAARPVVA